MTTAMLLRLLADHLLTLDPVDSGYLVNAARRRAEELDSGSADKWDIPLSWVMPAAPVSYTELNAPDGKGGYLIPDAPDAAPIIAELKRQGCAGPATAEPDSFDAHVSPCPRCGKSHWLTFDPVDNPTADFRAYAVCPVNHQPIPAPQAGPPPSVSGKLPPVISELPAVNPELPPADEPQTITWREFI